MVRDLLSSGISATRTVADHLHFKRSLLTNSHLTWVSRLALVVGIFAGGPIACTVPPPAEEEGKAVSASPEIELLPSPDDFSLLFQDDFDVIDAARWEQGSHTFGENSVQFSPEMVTTESGILRIGLAPNTTPEEGERSYLGGEMRTLDTFLYGRFETRAKFAPGSGVVSSLFTFYDHYSDPALPENWNELDIEFLGGHPKYVNFNVIHWSDGGHKTMHPAGAAVDFDPSSDFHVYTIDWLPDVVHFYVDGTLLHSQTREIKDHVNLPQKLMMNVWAVQNTPGLNEWAGEFDESALGNAAYYDWVRVYEYTKL